MPTTTERYRRLRAAWLQTKYEEDIRRFGLSALLAPYITGLPRRRLRLPRQRPRP